MSDDKIPKDEQKYKRRFPKLEFDVKYKIIQKKMRNIIQKKESMMKLDIDVHSSYEKEETMYHMDTFDIEYYLSKFNSEIPDRIFENVIFLLEKKWHELIQNQINEIKLEPFPEDSVCEICTRGMDEENPIFQCRGCNLVTHEKCYGMSEPSNSWICKKCMIFGNGFPECKFCPYTGGAYKQTADGNWGHVLCCIFSGNLSFLNLVFREPISIDEESKYEVGNCCICMKCDGFLVDCNYLGCKKKYHTMCGVNIGYYFDHSNIISYCKEHNPANSHKFWSIEDFFGFNNLKYREIRKKPHVHKTYISNMVSSSRVIGLIRHDVIFLKSTYSELLVYFNKISPEIIKNIYKYWISKRNLIGKSLIYSFSNYEINKKEFL